MGCYHSVVVGPGGLTAPLVSDMASREGGRVRQCGRVLRRQGMTRASEAHCPVG